MEMLRKLDSWVFRMRDSWLHNLGTEMDNKDVVLR
jgi:hypothetical protein